MKSTSCYLNFSWVLRDVMATVCSFVIAITPPNTINLIFLTLLFLAYGGNFTNRWTITIPLIPFLFFQVLRRIITGLEYNTSILLCFFSLCCTSTGAFLSYLFPIVQLNFKKGKYDVGVTDLFLPVEAEVKMNQIDDDYLVLNNVNVRILYPIVPSAVRNSSGKYTSISSRIPYIDHDISKEYLSQTIQLAPIPFVKWFTWILHYWRLISLPVYSNSLPNIQEKMPIVIFSHGLFGSCHLYSYQAYHLAAAGKLVLMVNHLDGSAPVAKRNQTGSLLPLDTSIFSLWREKRVDEYTERRRKQTNFRSDEIISSLISLLRMNQGDKIFKFLEKNIYLDNKLDINDITLIGHSFGGASVLSTAATYPNLIKAVIVQDPAIDWMDEPIRRALLTESRTLNSGVTYNGGPTGWRKKNVIIKGNNYGSLTGEEKKESDALRLLSSSNKSCTSKSVHDVDLFFLYSEEWHEKGIESSKILKQMHIKGQLGSKNASCRFDIIKDSKHQHFSDVNVITPNWLNKKLGVTGNRCSYSVLDEVVSKMLCFMDDAPSSLQ